MDHPGCGCDCRQWHDVDAILETHLPDVIRRLKSVGLPTKTKFPPANAVGQLRVYVPCRVHDLYLGGGISETLYELLAKHGLTRSEHFFFAGFQHGHEETGATEADHRITIDHAIHRRSVA